MTRHEAHKHIFKNSFLKDKQLQTLMTELGGTAAQVRVVGGAVRNALRRIPINDVDLACVHQPDETILRAERVGFRTEPTGISHGTVTVIGKDVHYEVTTLREDVETDGRHAVVRFGMDWQRDMERRDFTMNALCVDKEGVLHDLVSGLDDCCNGHVRFIGNAEQRIAEDALRIIRFFRFSAHFGNGALDERGLVAANNGVPLLRNLSAERIQSELKKILSVPDAQQLSVVIQAGSAVFDAIGLNVDCADHVALANCTSQDWAVRAVVAWRHDLEALRSTIVSLRFSNADVANIERLSDVVVLLAEGNPDEPYFVKKLAYQFGVSVVDDALYALSRFEQKPDSRYPVWVQPLKNWHIPSFPVKAADLMQLGMKPGPNLGTSLAQLEQIWMESRFGMSGEDLLAHAKLGLEEETK